MRQSGPRDLDPFQQQLLALKQKLGIAVPESEAAKPPTDPPAAGDRPTA
jgi:hypothetical protein